MTYGHLMKSANLITVDPAILGGKPVFKGTLKGTQMLCVPAEATGTPASP